jgi:hypothetical protein
VAPALDQVTSQRHSSYVERGPFCTAFVVNEASTRPNETHSSKAPVCHLLEPKGWQTDGVLRGQVSGALIAAH